MNIKKIIKEDIDDFDWIKNIQGEIPEVSDENKYLVLVELLGIDEVFGDITNFDDIENSDTNFQENSWTHYGITTYTLNNGEEWAVGTSSEFDDALYEYWTNFIDVGLEGVHNIEYWLEMSDTDRRFFASHMADSYLDNLSDDEVIETSGKQDEMDELIEEEEKLNDELAELDEELEEFDTDEEDVSDLVDKIDEINQRLREIESEKDDLIDTAKSIVYDIHYDEWYECLEDVVDCLVRQHGFYGNVDDLIRYNNAVQFDDSGWIEQQVSNSDYGELNNYDGNYEEVKGYIVIRLN